MSPVCVQHEVEMRCAQNGHFVQWNTARGPYQIWAGDRYECPVGGEAVVVGYGREPVAEHFENTFETWAARVQTTVVVR